MLNAKTHKPSKPGLYNVSFRNVMACFPFFAEWDGEKWVNIRRDCGFDAEVGGEMFFYDPAMDESK
jgi:hypothetical protein